MKLKTNEMRGITLIALVITIIVLLILAGVSIATLTGENGILTRADNAKTETTKAEAREMIQLETAASFDNTGKYSKDIAKANLKDNLGIAEGDIKDNGDETLTVKLDGYKFKVDDKGKVDNGTKIGVLPKTVKEAKEKETVFEENTKLTDTYGNSITIPEGFKIASDSAIDVTGGVVIEDATYSGTKGSQFVWIPVGTVTGTVNEVEKTATIELGRFEFTDPSRTGTRVITSPYTGTNVEENSRDKENLKKYGNEIAEDIEAFKTSTGIDKNGGYYIGRYEAGLDITSKLDKTTMKNNYTAPSENWTGWTKQDGSEAQIVCKQGQQVWNYITQNKASEVSKDMYKDTLPFTSDLINSYAWDTAIVFIQEFGEESNSSIYSIASGRVETNSEEPQTTGTSILYKTRKTDKQCNVFDMAGNCFEWSTETSEGDNSHDDWHCVFRGGRWLDDWESSSRNNGAVIHADKFMSFRPILYFYR